MDKPTSPLFHAPCHSPRLPATWLLFEVCVIVPTSPSLFAFNTQNDRAMYLLRQRHSRFTDSSGFEIWEPNGKTRIDGTDDAIGYGGIGSM